MPIRLRLLAAAMPLALMLPSPSFAMPTGGTCIEGNCEDGIGTFRETSTGLTTRGLFSNGRFAPSSTYEVVYPHHPGQVYHSTTDAQRNWVQAEMWRTESQFYAGSVKTAINPFTQHQVISYSVGRFEDGPDTVYEGQFEYVSLPPTQEQMQSYNGQGFSIQSGIYMFSGTRSSKSQGTKDYGIFATETVYPQKPILFSPADPARIADIRARYTAALTASAAQSKARADAMQAQQSAQDTDLIGTLFQAAAGGLLASSMGQMTGALGGGMGGVNAMNLSQVVGVMTGATSPDQAMAAMAQQYMAQGLGAAVGATSPQDFAALAAGMASGGAVPTTQGAVTAAMLTQAQTLAQQKTVTTTPAAQTIHIPPNGGAPSATPNTGSTPVASGSGSRVPKLEQMTLPCTNENGSFTGSSKVPKAAADCRAEVIAHRKVQCRSDWMTDPSYAAMKACFQQKGIADLSQWR